MAKKKIEPEQKFIGVKAQFSCACHNDPTCVSCQGTGFFERVVGVPELMEYLGYDIDNIAQEAIQLDKHLSREDH